MLLSSCPTQRSQPRYINSNNCTCGGWFLLSELSSVHLWACPEVTTTLLDYCNFVVSFENEKVWVSQLSPFFSRLSGLFLVGSAYKFWDQSASLCRGAVIYSSIWTMLNLRSYFLQFLCLLMMATPSASHVQNCTWVKNLCEVPHPVPLLLFIISILLTRLEHLNPQGIRPYLPNNLPYLRSLLCPILHINCQ